jgi:uncharacterized membrane-anchored protein
MITGQWFTRRKEKVLSETLEVRLGRRTKVLAPTLPTGCLVVIDHPDLDAVAAQMLLRARPVAIINCQPFVTGRYPNRGPRVLLDAGILLYEAPGDAIFSELSDSEHLSLSDRRLGALELLTLPVLEQRLLDARQNLDTELQRFAQNTLQFLEKPEERSLLLETAGLPSLKTNLMGRHVLVVVRGEGYEQDLERLNFYLREQKPVVIAVDGAADALLARGIRPALVLGDMDSVSDAALRCGAEVIVHAYPDGRAPGKERVDALGVPVTLFPIAGTSEDAAMLLAYEKGADLIVAVGTHSNLEDFLDKGRGGMASTFLVRLKVGSRLVDARGVSRLYGNRPSASPLLLYLTLAALFPVVVLAASTDWGRNLWNLVSLWIRSPFRN